MRALALSFERVCKSKLELLHLGRDYSWGLPSLEQRGGLLEGWFRARRTELIAKSLSIAQLEKDIAGGLRG